MVTGTSTVLVIITVTATAIVLVILLEKAGVMSTIIIIIQVKVKEKNKDSTRKRLSALMAPDISLVDPAPEMAWVQDLGFPSDVFGFELCLPAPSVTKQ